eukprot:scaffold6112_cov487-Prasinococcus_capsulatus_cf.AAC.1
MALLRDSLAAPARTSMARNIARPSRVVKPAKHTLYPTSTSHCLGLSRLSDTYNRDATPSSFALALPACLPSHSQR